MVRCEGDSELCTASQEGTATREQACVLAPGRSCAYITPSHLPRRPIGYGEPARLFRSVRFMRVQLCGKTRRQFLIVIVQVEYGAQGSRGRIDDRSHVLQAADDGAVHRCARHQRIVAANWSCA